MAITAVRIHPAIGVARVGNCPDEFFIGPETPGETEPPAGGFKDAACRIKRLAARFRLWAYDGNTPLNEVVLGPDVKITWTAQIANTKAAGIKFPDLVALRNNTAPDREKLKIKPSARSVAGANDQAFFDDGKVEFPGLAAVTVPLGELRTDDQGRLLVLGGKGHSASPNNSPIQGFASSDNWYDDVADGWVNAEVEIEGQIFQAVPAWVVVGPPRYAPDIDQITTLWDVAFEVARSQGWLAVPASPSLKHEIYPLLRRADRARWVRQPANLHGGWAETYPLGAATRNFVFGKMRDPDNPNGTGNMPALYTQSFSLDLTVTRAQYAMLKAWKDGNFTDDYNDPDPPLGPAMLDRVALDHTVGATFFPGIEASVKFATPNLWLQPFQFRLDPSQLAPGDLTQNMALPWQSDFYACNDDWWPSHRPNQVKTQSDPGVYVDWARGVGNNIEMVNKWATLGFVLKQGDRFLEVERCDTPYVVLLTPSLDFGDVPQGPGGMTRWLALAATFEVFSANPVTLSITAGPGNPQLSLPLGNSDGTTGGPDVEMVRLWVVYATSNVGDTLNAKITVSQQGTSNTWEIPITAKTVGRKKSVVGLALDRSGSMTENRGDGKTKIDSLRETGKIFVDLMLQDDAILISRFNEDAQLVLGQTVLGDPNNNFDIGRAAAKKIFDPGSPDLVPGGYTSIGDGIHVARQDLDLAAGFDTRALIALTDGKENRPLWLADIGTDINAHTFAVGFGQPQNISVGGLQKIAGNHSGYLVVTGAITTQNEFLLSKFFLQILAGVTNAEVVVDPQDVLQPGGFHRIPFEVCEADSGLDVIVLSRQPQALDFRLETPLGSIIDAAEAAANPTVDYFVREGVSFYRLSLPQFASGRPTASGLWHAHLRYRGRGEQAMPYSFLVHAYSDARLKASIHQKSFEPFSPFKILASIDQYGIPLRRPARVWATITLPDGREDRVALVRDTQGSYRADFDTQGPGVYRVRVQAHGDSLRGHSFRRERTLTVQVWEGGDRDDGHGDDRPDERHRERPVRPGDLSSAQPNRADLLANLRQLVEQLERG